VAVGLAVLIYLAGEKWGKIPSITTGKTPSAPSPILEFVGDMLGEIFPSRVRSAPNACMNNLRQISGARDQYALDHDGKEPTAMKDLTPTYVTKEPTCWAGGRYYLGKLGEDPACSKGYSMPGDHTI
jgi:hypothetical protein